LFVADVQDSAVVQNPEQARMRPRQFGKYTLLEKIGTGGMAEIFKAVSRGAGDFQKVLVIKRILVRYSRDPAFVKMFKDEALITAPLQHANIVSIYEFDQVDGQYYLAMDLVNGVDLQAVMARANKIGAVIPPGVALFIIGEVCKALWYAYNARDAYGKPLKIIHRDVSPSNILISFDGEVKVTDFGVAKAANSKNEGQTGVLKGKLGYMSPETVLGREIDNRSDLFSLGIILFEILTLKRMFLGKTDLQTLINIRDADADKRLSKHPEIDDGVASIIRKSLAREPDDRYPGAQEFLDDIQDYLFGRRLRVSQIDVANLMKELFAEKVERELLPLGSEESTTGVSGRVSTTAIRNAPSISEDEYADEDDDSRDDEDRDQPEPEPEPVVEPPSRAGGRRKAVAVPPPGDAPEHEQSQPTIGKSAGSDESGDLPIDDKSPEPSRESTRNTKVKPEVATFRIRDAAGNIFGPVSFENVLSLLRSRALTEDELVSVDNGDWQRLGDVSIVQSHLGQIRPVIDRNSMLFDAQIDRRFNVRMLTRVCRRQILSGLLVFKKGVHQKEIYFVKGRPKVVFSNLKSELLGEYLVRRQLVAREKLADALKDMASGGGRLGDSLINHGAVGSHELALFLADQFKDRFLDIFTWEEGWCGFFEGVKVPQGVVQHDMDPMELISQGVRTMIPPQMINAWMSEYAQQRMVFASDAKVTVEELKLIPRELRVVNLIGARDTIRALLDGLPQGGDWPFVVNRVVYLLLETGIVRFRTGR